MLFAIFTVTVIWPIILFLQGVAWVLSKINKYGKVFRKSTP